jgi:hypothetical protein
VKAFSCVLLCVCALAASAESPDSAGQVIYSPYTGKPIGGGTDDASRLNYLQSKDLSASDKIAVYENNALIIELGRRRYAPAQAFLIELVQAQPPGSYLASAADEALFQIGTVGASVAVFHRFRWLTAQAPTQDRDKELERTRQHVAGIVGRLARQGDSEAVALLASFCDGVPAYHPAALATDRALLGNASPQAIAGIQRRLAFLRTLEPSQDVVYETHQLVVGLAKSPAAGSLDLEALRRSLRPEVLTVEGRWALKGLMARAQRSGIVWESTVTEFSQQECEATRVLWVNPHKVDRACYGLAHDDAGVFGACVQYPIDFNQPCGLVTPVGEEQRPLRVAAEQLNEPAVERLIAAGVDVKKAKTVWPLISSCARSNDLLPVCRRILQALLSAGEDINDRHLLSDPNFVTGNAIAFAGQGGYVNEAVLDMLLQAGADIDSHGPYFCTALDFASSRNDEQGKRSVAALKRRGAKHSLVCNAHKAMEAVLQAPCLLAGCPAH